MNKIGFGNEIGAVGTPGVGGYINAAYLKQLAWPTGWPEFNRLWRTDPEVAIVRQLFTAMAGKLEVVAELPAGAEGNDADKRAVEFYESVMQEAGLERWLQAALSKVPFMGWGWWEVPYGVRSPSFSAPDGWRSRHSDGLIAIRAISFRDYSTFQRWEMEQGTGRVIGFWQSVPEMGKYVCIPADRSAHIIYGDLDNPEGLSPLEAVYRLERHTYGLGLVQGIGYEHTAGHVVFTVAGQLDDGARGELRRAARAILTAQEGNYVTEIVDRFTTRVVDVPFQAADSLNRTIDSLRLLKLAIFGMQFVGIGTISGTGSYAALDDSSSLAMTIFNSTAEGFLAQFDAQIGGRLFQLPRNKEAFAGMSLRPELRLRPAAKRVSLPELGQFAQLIHAISPLTDDDLTAIRVHSGVLPTNPAGSKAEQGRPAGNKSEMAELAQHSAAPMVEKSAEYERMIRLFADGLRAQYENVDVAKIVREIEKAGIDPSTPDALGRIEAIVAPYVRPIAETIDVKGLVEALSRLAALGEGYGLSQIPLPLTAAQTIAVAQEISRWVTGRVLSLVASDVEVDGIEPPYLGLRLDLVSRRDIARLVRDAMIEGTDYNKFVREMARRRAERIADNEAATAFGVGQQKAVEPTQPTHKTWLRTISKTPRPEHLAQVGVRIPYGDYFPDGSFWANELPHCKCGIQVDYE